MLSVKFMSSSTSLVRRRLTYVLGWKTVLSDTQGAFLRHMEAAAPVRTCTDAFVVCRSSTFYGLAGRLSTIQSQADNLRLRAMGAEGWIGARGNQFNEWTWTPDCLSTGPLFWKGAGVRGEALNDSFVQWSNGQPASMRNVAYLYGYFSASGQWRAVANSTASNVICQYGGQGAVLSADPISGQRNVKPQGCYAAPCVELSQAACKADAQCSWVSQNGSALCAYDSWCAKGLDTASCNRREQCYWDYSIGLCRSAPPNLCSLQNMTRCGTFPQCVWDGALLPRAPTATAMGACVFRDCAVHAAESPCSADWRCRWEVQSGALASTGSCLRRLCGYAAESQCWADTLCAWSGVTSQCEASPCLNYTTEAACRSADSCSFDASSNVCYWSRCNTTKGKTECLKDAGCVFVDRKCLLPDCTATTEAECKKKALCHYLYSPNRCLAAQCVSHTNLADCEQQQQQTQKKPCIWEGTRCRQPTFKELYAPESPSACSKEVDPSLVPVWIACAVCLLLIALICWRLYLVVSSGMTFFDPIKNKKVFSPHQQYAKELFDEAQQVGVETNVRTPQPEL